MNERHALPPFTIAYIKKYGKWDGQKKVRVKEKYWEHMKGRSMRDSLNQEKTKVLED